jgi:hypothetical protein|uniref:Uncharacterized protein n=1 Tax=viral metagenome TaxID=1070528 RepID=A0A6C0EVC1_9ZZZZ
MIPQKGVYTKCEKAENKLPYFWDINRIFRWQTFPEKCPEFGIVVVLKYISVKKEDKKQFGGL